MPDLLERPPNQFTTETAREAAYRSHKAQEQLKEDGLRFRELALEQAKQPPIEAKPETDALREAQRQIELANKLLVHAHSELELMKDDTYGFCPECKRHGANAKDQAALIREIRGLMEHLCRLHNIAQAPTSKAVQPKQRRPEPMPEPTIPQAVVVQPTPEQPK